MLQKAWPAEAVTDAASVLRPSDTQAVSYPALALGPSGTAVADTTSALEPRGTEAVADCIGTKAKWRGGCGRRCIGTSTERRGGCVGLKFLALRCIGINQLPTPSSWRLCSERSGSSSGSGAVQSASGSTGILIE